MGAVLTAVRERARLDRGIMPNGTTVQTWDVPDVLTGKAGEAIGIAAESAPQEAWDIFRNGTDEEFAVLVNQLDCLGSAFNNDHALRTVMNLARQRCTPEVLEETRAGFGALFDQFWAETEPVTKSHTFGEMLQPTGT